MLRFSFVSLGNWKWQNPKTVIWEVTYHVPVGMEIIYLCIPVKTGIYVEHLFGNISICFISHTCLQPCIVKYIF